MCIVWVALYNLRASLCTDVFFKPERIRNKADWCVSSSSAVWTFEDIRNTPVLVNPVFKLDAN